jgi:hypothetical protein
MQEARIEGVMSETTRREFLSGAAKLAGVSAVAAVGGSVPAVGLAASRGRPGTTIVATPPNAIVETSAGKVRGFERNGIFTFRTAHRRRAQLASSRRRHRRRGRKYGRR